LKEGQTIEGWLSRRAQRHKRTWTGGVWKVKRVIDRYKRKRKHG